MPTVFHERLHLNGRTYSTDARPLEPYLDGLDVRPRFHVTPFNVKGYMAGWETGRDVLYLVDLGGDMPGQLFPHRHGGIPASWFSGLIHAWCGTPRHTGYPPRRFFDDEVILEVVSGRVRRQWQLDLRGVPDQISDELRRSLPRSLFRPE